MLNLDISFICDHQQLLRHPPPLPCRWGHGEDLNGWQFSKERPKLLFLPRHNLACGVPSLSTHRPSQANTHGHNPLSHAPIDTRLQRAALEQDTRGAHTSARRYPEPQVRKFTFDTPPHTSSSFLRTPTGFFHPVSPHYCRTTNIALEVAS
jgi:hypothetical protein